MSFICYDTRIDYPVNVTIVTRAACGKGRSLLKSTGIAVPQTSAPEAEFLDRDESAMIIRQHVVHSVDSAEVSGTPQGKRFRTIGYKSGHKEDTSGCAH